MRNSKLYKIAAFMLIIFTVGCSSTLPQLIPSDKGYIEVNQRPHTSLKSQKMDSILLSYKEGLDRSMSKVIAIASKDYPKTAPEYALQQCTLKALSQTAQNYSKTKIDGAIMNIDGARNNLYKGEVTLGIIYSLFPFDNQMTILTIKGKHLKQLEQQHESVARIITTGFATFDNEALYTIATIDYLAEGNDQCSPLKSYEKEHKTTLMLRDIMIDFFKKTKL